MGSQPTQSLIFFRPPPSQQQNLYPLKGRVKITINQKVRFLLQISQLTNANMLKNGKVFKTFLGMNIIFQMRETPTMVASYLWRNLVKLFCNLFKALLNQYVKAIA